MQPINVLSLFDGCSGGNQALEMSGIKVANYYACEIDKYAIQVTQANYPNTIQLGDVTKVDFSKLPKIDLLIGGSPCQSFSFAGKRNGMSTKDSIEILTLDHYLELKKEAYEFEGQSYLFWEYMNALTILKPKYFLLENVEMGEKWEKVLSKAIGVNGIHINSALLTAQNRKRIYWFGQIRERLFYNDNFCYICKNDKNYGIRENTGILGKTQNKRATKVLGEAQGRQINVQNLQSRILENKQERDNENLLNNLSTGVKKTNGQKQGQGETKNKSSELHKQQQGTLVAISKGLQENEERERNFKKSRAKSIEENSKINENAFTQRTYWSKEEANKRRIDYHTKYGKGMCCMQCSKKLNHRPYKSFIEGWDECPIKSPSSLSEVQFNEARQNNGRVFDIFEIGEIDGDLFGEIILPIQQPKDKKIVLKDILENEVNEKYFLSEKAITGILNHKKEQKEKGTGFGAVIKNENDNMIICHNTMPRSSKTGKGGTGHLSRNDGKTYCLDTGNTNALEIKCVAMRGRGENNEQQLEERKDNKTNCLTSVQKDNLIINTSRIRRLTPLECERLQGMKDNFTNFVSDSQRYKMIGNGWTIPVISHLFNYIK